MNEITAEEKRALTKDEYELVVQSRTPVLTELTPQELGKLARRLREYRTKARDLSRQQRREMRGKSAPRGTVPANTNEGQNYKKDIFNNAIKRVDRRLKRLETEKSRQQMQTASQKALTNKKAARARQNRPESGRTADKGMQVVSGGKQTVKPNPAEKGRVSQFVKNAQGKRDSR